MSLITPLQSDQVLHREIPYRLDAVAAMNVAVKWALKSNTAKPMQIWFEGQLTVEGSSSAFVNPVIEAGLVHCRALLEFVGLKADSSNPLRLSSRLGKRRDDYGIEDFAGPNGPLPLVTPDVAIARYPGDRVEGESSLAFVLSSTNKVLAHLTKGLVDPPERLQYLEIASRGVRAIVVSHLYTPLGLASPYPRITTRKRNAA